MWVEANSGSGGGGGTETETTLWENPSPTSSFSSTTVTLSDVFTNYKKIAFYYKAEIGSTDESRVIYEKAEMLKWLPKSPSAASVAYGGGLSAFYYSGSSQAYIRSIWRYSDDSNENKLRFSATGRIGNSSTYNSYCIPTKVTGIN